MAKDLKSRKENRREPEVAGGESARRSESQPTGEFNFAEYKKSILADPKARKVIEDFLKNRHREWEENLCRKPKQSAKRKTR